MNFTTIFHWIIGNTSCEKAEVQIPYNISKNHNIKTQIFYVKKWNFAYKWSEFIDEYKWIPIKWFKNIWIWNLNFTILRYLINNSKNIDILHLIHLVRQNIIYGLIYKFLNPKWKLYIMMDFDPTSYTKETIFWSNVKFLWKFFYKFTNYFINKCDCLSVETTKWYDFLINYNTSIKNKLVYIPNGFNYENMKELIWKINNFQEKENLILTVWRIWHYQKNTELFLEALKKVELKNWKVWIIWPIEQEFEETIKTFFEQNPDLKDKILFKWPIYDKKKLFEIYNKSKIFCLTSRWESFGIVLVEAMYFGNFIITTDISSAFDVTWNWKYWYIVSQNNPEHLATQINHLINNPQIIQNNIEINHKNAIKKFSLKNLVEKIRNKMF